MVCVIPTIMTATSWAIPLFSFLLTGFFGILSYVIYTNKLARRSVQARHAILKNLGIPTASNPKFIAFFHPYWYGLSTNDWVALLMKLMQ